MLMAAYNGTRVLPETAHELWKWALTHYGVELDQQAMVSAPPAPPRKKRAA